ncbi:GNAT family N-acetyltransferase [Streptomyces sp. NPDC053474]|uniref:GNAT family N-acetyltransferase n=1 Tax=Streptomyces sp. NPDC053474 TaxID=3365704 RepID=UPI0037D39744
MSSHPAIVLMTNTDPAFYRTLGPYLARPDVHKYIEGVPWDEDTKTWLVLNGSDGQMRGFCAVNQTTTRTRRTLLESLYVLPDHRDSNAVDILVQAAVREFGHDRDLHATVHHDIAPAYHKAGFHEVKKTTRMTHLVRPATIRE